MLNRVALSRIPDKNARRNQEASATFPGLAGYLLFGTATAKPDTYSLTVKSAWQRQAHRAPRRVKGNCSRARKSLLGGSRWGKEVPHLKQDSVTLNSTEGFDANLSLIRCRRADTVMPAPARAKERPKETLSLEERH